MAETKTQPGGSRDREVTYALDGVDLTAVAGAVAAALDVNLHEHRSPMIGPWYCDVSPTALAAALEAAQPGRDTAARPSTRARVTQARVVLTRNDPEPGVVPVDVPGGGSFVLRLWLRPDAVDEVEARLREAGAPPRRAG